MKNETPTNRRAMSGGYTLLFAVLTSALVLGVAVFIVNVSKKQFELSVASRNSMYAFYAADSGIECAVNGPNWSSSEGGAYNPDPGVSSVLSCGGYTVSFVAVNPVVFSPANIIEDGVAPNVIRQKEGWINLANTGTSKGCAKVTITTGQSVDDGKPVTIFDSRGYNQCINDGASPDIYYSGTVERALRLMQHGVW